MSALFTSSATKALAQVYAKRRDVAVGIVASAMQKTAWQVVADMKRRMQAGGQNTVAVRSGQLRDRLTQQTTMRGSVVKTEIGTNVIYGRIQEYGGVITPKRAQYLSIPVGPALTASGVSRFASPRMVSDLFVVRSKSGGLRLVRNDGGRLVTYFVLVKSVRLKPKLGLRDTITRFYAGAGSAFDMNLRQAVKQVMRVA